MSRSCGQASEKIRLSVKGQDGSTVNYSIPRNIKLSRLFHSYCDKKEVDYQTARFVYEGRRLSGKLTADKQKLENGDEICCMFSQTGGGFFIVPKAT